MMGMMGSSMVGSVAGSVIGHGVSQAMFGGGGGGQQQQAAPEAAQGGQPQPCAVELDHFFACLKDNNNDQNFCQAYLEQLQYCRQQAQ